MASPISKNAQRIAPSVTLAISAKAKEMKAQGIDVIALSAGEPDFDTPAFIKDAAIEAIRKGFTKYTPAVGIPELRKAVCAKFERDNGLLYDSSQIVVGCGAKHTLFTSILALVGEGDEVIIPTPYWVTYSEQPKIAGGNPVIVETGKEEGYKLTPPALKAAITPRTKALVLNSPSNPSGVVYTKEELEALADVVLETELYVISDEIYEKILYDGAQHHSIAALRDRMLDRTIVVNGVSKTYAMTGWRIGYAAGPKEIISTMGKIQSQETSNPTSISQMAALAALNGPQDCLDEMLQAFDERRRFIVNRLNDIEGVSCPTPQGAFYVFPEVASLYGSTFNEREIDGSVALCSYLLEEVKVACVPGAGFGADAHIRLSYATSMDHINTAMDRIDQGIAALQK